MSNDPLALSEFFLESPKEADYETLYAAVMATEQGRQFLAEYANRNRQADTHMLVGAIARVEAAIRGEPPPAPAVGPQELIEIAAAIGRIEAEIAAGQTPAPDGSAALERIQDIAFVLHERPVEATLCDALDAAVREISEVCARSDSAAERARKATELLHALASRVSGIVPSTAHLNVDLPVAEKVVVRSPDAKPESASGDAAAFEGVIERSAPPHADRFDVEAEDEESAVRSVAALAASLPAGAPEPELIPQSRWADAVPLLPDSEDKTEAPQAEGVADSMALITLNEEFSSDEPAIEHVPSARASSEAALSENILFQVQTTGQLATPDTSGEEAPSEQLPGAKSLSDEPPSGGLLPSQNFSSKPVADSQDVVAHPQKDPGEIFEPLAVPSPLGTPAFEATVPSGEPDTSREEQALSRPSILGEHQTFAVEAAAEMSSALPRAVEEPVLFPTQRPEAYDPLAAVRALSEEEVIALFS